MVLVVRPKFTPTAPGRGGWHARLAGIGQGRERLEKLRVREFSAKTIQGLIDANARTLGDAMRRNAARWRGAAGYYPDQLTFDEDVAQMKAWIEARVKWLDAEIERRTSAMQ